jgi:hypothetical protein
MAAQTSYGPAEAAVSDPGPGRILVADCGRGWQLWHGNPPAPAGVIVAPHGPLTPHDPRPAGVAGDVRFYAIHDPREPGADPPAGGSPGAGLQERLILVPATPGTGKGNSGRLGQEPSRAESAGA